MSLLLVDIGNSRLKWAEKQGQTIETGLAFLLREDIFELQLEQVWKSIAQPVRVLVANVAGEGYLHRLADWVNTHWQLDIEPIQSQAQAFGVTNAYSRAQTLGVDRWLALISVRHHFPLPACIINCGTAVTADGLDQKGVHLGGVIMPGLRLMQATLVQSTHAIKDISDSGFKVLANNTTSAVYSGAMLALLGMTKQFIHYTATQLGQEVTVVITGGDAETIAQKMTEPHHISPDLVLQGLAIVADQG